MPVSTRSAVSKDSSNGAMSGRKNKRTQSTVSASSADSVKRNNPQRKSSKPKAKKTKTASDMGATSVDTPWYHVFTKRDEEYNTYMATEWSFEKRGDRALFEKLSLEAAQSGLSWLTILRKREAYRSTFWDFDPHRVAEMTEGDVDRILAQEDKLDPRRIIVRHRGKIEAVINNAKCVLKLQQETGDSENALDRFLWSFVNDQPVLNQFGNFRSVQIQDFPSQTEESQAMSKALKRAGWKFVGPTTCYAMMQAVGMVIDHPADSPEWHQAKERLEKRLGGYQNRSKMN